MNNDFSNQYNFEEQNNNSNVSMQNKKGNNAKTFILCLVVLAIGVFIGLYGPKLLKKASSNNEAKQEINKDANTENTNEEPVEEQKQEEVSKPQANSKYKLINSSTISVKLNNKNYDLVAFYYEGSKNSIRKEVYFNGNIIEKLNEAFVLVDKKDYAKKVNEDIDYIKNTISTLNDAKSSDQYLIYYSINEDATGPEGDPWVVTVITANVVNSTGNVLFSKWSDDTMHGEWLAVDSKNEVLDRVNYYDSCDDLDEEDRADNFTCNKYIVYNGDGKDREEKYFKGDNVEFKNDHFYAVTSFYEDSDNKEYGQNVYDYKFTIENGKLVKKLLKKYSYEHLGVAGAE